MKKIIPFNYFGGKFSHLDWILPLLPPTKTYVEVFGGSGVVLLNRQPSRIEAYNDINSVIVNFFTVLRCNPEELISRIYLTPYSIEEYQFCYQHMNEGDDIERARRFFVAVNQSFNGSYSRQTGWKMSTIHSRAKVSEAVNRWLNKIPNLEYTVARLRQVQICNHDYKVIFEKFDSADCLFYCDPPYLHEVRCNKNEYDHELSIQEHIEFLHSASQLQGKIAISGYDSDLYNSHLSGFFKTEAKDKRTGLFHSMKREILWTNYDPQEFSLFSSNFSEVV